MPLSGQREVWFPNFWNHGTWQICFLVPWFIKITFFCDWGLGRALLPKSVKGGLVSIVHLNCL